MNSPECNRGSHATCNAPLAFGGERFFKCSCACHPAATPPEPEDPDAAYDRMRDERAARREDYFDRLEIAYERSRGIE